MRAVLLAAFVVSVTSSVYAQEIDWGKPPPDKAVLAVILPASESPYEISDKGSFVDIINAQSDQTLVKSYTVDPGIYSIVASGSTDEIKVDASAGSVQVVEFDPYKNLVLAEDFSKVVETLKSVGASNWTWVGQQTFDPQENLIFIAHQPGTEDPGPMQKDN